MIYLIGFAFGALNSALRVSVKVDTQSFLRELESRRRPWPLLLPAGGRNSGAVKRGALNAIRLIIKNNSDKVVYVVPGPNLYRMRHFEYGNLPELNGNALGDKLEGYFAAPTLHCWVRVEPGDTAPSYWVDTSDTAGIRGQIEYTIVDEGTILAAEKGLDFRPDAPYGPTLARRFALNLEVKNRLSKAPYFVTKIDPLNVSPFNIGEILVVRIIGQ